MEGTSKRGATNNGTESTPRRGVKKKQARQSTDGVTPPLPPTRSSSRSRSRSRAPAVTPGSTGGAYSHQVSSFNSTSSDGEEVLIRTSDTSDPAYVPIPHRKLWMENDETTCFDFGLQGHFDAHRRIMCNNCILHCNRCLEYSWNPLKKNRNKNHQCEQPWNEKGHMKSRYGEKTKHCQKFHTFFEHETTVTVPDGSDSKKPAQKKSNNQQQSNQNVAGLTSGAARTQSSKDGEGAITTGSCISPINNSVDSVESNPIVVLFDESLVFTVEAVESMKKAIQERDLEACPLQEHECGLIEAMISMSPSHAKQPPVDTNHVLTEDCVRSMTDALIVRDTESWPFQQHEIELAKVLTTDGSTIRPSAAKVLESCLQLKQDGISLEDHENRLLGQFAYKGLKSSKGNKLTVKSFKHFKPFQIAKVPEYRATRTTVKENKKRTYNNHVAVAKEWMAHLPSSFSDELLSSFIKEQPEIARFMLAKHHKYLFQQSAVQTLVMQAYGGFNDTQKDKIGRSMEFFSGGMRFTASKHETAALKKEYLLKNFTTLRHDKIQLAKKVSVGGNQKGSTITKARWCTVTKTHPCENILVKMEGLLSEKKFIPSAKRYREPWTRDPRFKDSVLWRLSFDTGGGSMKGVMGLLNVENPHSQRHILPILEFSGVKDTDYNVRTAAFRNGDFVRQALDWMFDRCLILQEVTIGGETQVVLVRNTNGSHDKNAPKAMVENISGYTEYTPQQPADDQPAQPVQFYERMAEVDVQAVASVKLLRNSVTKSTDGVCYFDSDGNELSRALFRVPIQECDNEPKVCQYLMAAMFTADLEFLSKFLGHQGASARYLCMFCLACKAALSTTFLNGGTRTIFDKRTLEMLKRDGKLYNDMMSKLIGDQKKKQRGEITRGHTHSIVGIPMADVDPSDSCAPATVHVILGMTPWLVKVKRRSYRRLEALESAARSPGTAPAQFQESVEESIRLATEYEAYLLKELAGTMSAVAAQQEMINNLCTQIAYHQHFLNQSSSGSWEQVVWNSRLEQLREQQQIATEVRNKLSEEKLENEAHLMEQLFVTRQTKEEFIMILKKHEGHASRVVGNAMNNHGVDENVYHQKSIDGNHCLIFGEKGNEIVDDVTTEMRKHIKDEKNIQYLEKLDSSLKEILRLWYKLMLVMKSVKRQSRQAIAQFKANTIALNKAIKEFVTNEPVPGTGNTLPTFLKSHLLFDYHIQDFLEVWETLGGMDEQSMESTHPQFNQLLRRYGNTRGHFQKMQVIRQYLFERASFIYELLDEMVAKTSKTKRPNTKKRGSQANDCDMVNIVDVTHDPAASKLSAMEEAMNGNELLHPMDIENCPPNLDTCISACKHCGKRMVNFAAAVHEHEYHSGLISNDVDDNIMERMKLEAAL